MTATQWTKEQVEDLLRTEYFRYQRIELPYGLATAGRDRSATARQIFPSDMTGKSVLDLGCSHGFFCFEAVKRGATRVVGYDLEAEAIRKNRLLADCLGAKVEFEVRDIESEPIVETFDYVLCLNLLHHMHNPLSVLDNLVRVARERLILEMASFGGHDQRRLRLFPFVGNFLALAPIIYVSRNGTTGKKPPKKFYMTRGAIRNLLVHHRHFYARVDMQPSEHKDRYLVIAQRQKIEHLVVVAGPTAVGKSTFCDLFLKGELGDVYARLGVDPRGEEVTFVTARVESNPSRPELGNVLFHYDILRPFMRSARVHARDEALDILDAADKVTFLTLWTSPEKLRKQIGTSKFSLGNGLFNRPTKRHRAIRSSYEEPRRIVEHYDEWFEFVATKPGESMVADLSGGKIRFLSQQQWNTEVAPLRK